MKNSALLVLLTMTITACTISQQDSIKTTTKITTQPPDPPVEQIPSYMAEPKDTIAYTLVKNYFDKFLDSTDPTEKLISDHKNHQRTRWKYSTNKRSI
jgi:hypothetical protein